MSSENSPADVGEPTPEILFGLPRRVQNFLAEVAVHTYCMNTAYQKMRLCHRLNSGEALGRFDAAKILQYASARGFLTHMIPTVYHAGRYSEDYREGLSTLARRGLRLFDDEKHVSITNGKVRTIEGLASFRDIDVEGLVTAYETVILPRYYRDWGSRGVFKEDVGMKSVHDHLEAFADPSKCLYASSWADEPGEPARILVGVTSDPVPAVLVDLDSLIDRLRGLFKEDVVARTLGKELLKRKRDLLPMQLRVKRFNLEAAMLGDYSVGIPVLWVCKITKVLSQDLFKYVCEATATSISEDALQRATVWVDIRGLKSQVEELLDTEVVVVGRIAKSGESYVNKALGIFKLGEPRGTLPA